MRVADEAGGEVDREGLRIRAIAGIYFFFRVFLFVLEFELLGAEIQFGVDIRMPTRLSGRPADFKAPEFGVAPALATPRAPIGARRRGLRRLRTAPSASPLTFSSSPRSSLSPVPARRALPLSLLLAPMRIPLPAARLPVPGLLPWLCMESISRLGVGGPGSHLGRRDRRRCVAMAFVRRLTRKQFALGDESAACAGVVELHERPVLVLWNQDVVGREEEVPTIAADRLEPDNLSRIENGEFGQDVPVTGAAPMSWGRASADELVHIDDFVGVARRESVRGGEGDPTVVGYEAPTCCSPARRRSWCPLRWRAGRGAAPRAARPSRCMRRTAPRRSRIEDVHLGGPAQHPEVVEVAVVIPGQTRLGEERSVLSVGGYLGTDRVRPRIEGR